MEIRTPLGPLAPTQQNIRPAELDFSKLTPSQFGISSQSFTDFPKEKDRSRVAQLKSRRRSNIGVRGSPETNSLIVFRAKQATKTPPRTPQHLLASPMLSGCNSIKQKMAVFQRLMGTDEENIEQVSSGMKMEEEEEAEKLSKDVQSDCPEERLTPNTCHSPLTPPLSKRRHRATPYRGECEEEEENPEELQQTPLQQQQVSHSERRGATPTAGLGSDSQSQLVSWPMLSEPELIKTGDIAVSSASKKKRVHFGAPLSPEFFDKTLPPSTPLQKGATPLCPPSSTGRKLSLLKTPQRFEFPLPQPDFDSPAPNEASTVLHLQPCSDLLENDEVFMEQKISFPVLDEEHDKPLDDFKDTESALALPHHAPGSDSEVMDAAFQEVDELSFAADHPAELSDPEPHPVPEPIPSQPDLPGGSTEAPRPRGRKRKQPAKPETEPETRRSSRSAAATATGKMKTSAALKRFGSKEVDRSLYGKRDYASKNPLLSPIVESNASSLSNTPTQTHSDPVGGPASSSARSPRNDALVTAAAMWRQRFLQKAEVAAVAPSDSKTVAPVSTGRSNRGQRGSGTRRSWNAAKSSKTSENLDEDVAALPSETISLQTETHDASPSRESHQKPEQSHSEEAAPAGKLTQKCGGNGKRGRKSQRLNPSSEENQQHLQREWEKTCEEPSAALETVTEQRKEDLNPENKVASETLAGEEMQRAEPQQMSETTSAELTVNQEPWQQDDFNIEDILKPLPKSRLSVRRSLRHRRSVDSHAQGLTWVDHTSPEPTRRRTRGRLSGVSLPPPLSDASES